MFSFLCFFIMGNYFLGLVMMESDWLDRLEKKLKRSPESAADAEEISENLDVSIL